MVNGLVLLCLVCALSRQFVGADETCVDYNKQIEPKIFDPVREAMEQHNASTVNIDSFTGDSPFGISIEAINGKIGRFTNFELDPEVGASLCTDSEPLTTVSTLQATIAIKEITAEFEYFAIFVPVLPTIGDTKTTLSLKDAAIHFSISTAQNGTTCKAALNSIEIRNFGELRFLTNRSSGVWNEIYQMIIYYAWPYFTSLLKEFNIDILHNTLLLIGSHSVNMNREIICQLI